MGAVRTATWGLITLCAAVGLYVLALPPIGDVTERWQTGNGVFNIRIDQRAEDLWLFGLPGAYYVFQSSHSEGPWREVMTFRHDDPVPIPRENIRFVNDRIAFVFMGWMFAITTDGGNKWSTWNAQTDLPKWDCCNYRLIKDVNILPSGTGTMTLEVIEDRSGEEVPLLKTTDFGRHWAPS